MAGNGHGSFSHRSSRPHLGERVDQAIHGKDFVYFTRHALNRMKQRRISKDEVYFALRNPTETGLPTQPHRERIRWTRGIAAIDVVFEEREDHYRIITCMKLTVAAEERPKRDHRKNKQQNQRQERRGKKK